VTFERSPRPVHSLRRPRRARARSR
jgi:hypothetical protein